MGEAWWWVGAGAVLAVALVVSFVWWQGRRRRLRLDRIRKDFHRRREYLEAKFFELASGSGKPRGLEWTHCDFADDVAYARDRQSGDLTALVGVTISFAAIEGGGMEEVEAVGNLRAATAVFRHLDGAWQTEGRAIFNLNPSEAIDHFRSSLELVAEDVK